MLKNLKNKKKKKGFTLIELIIVIAIIALLAALAIPKFGQVRKDAALKSDIANAKTIANATSTLIAEGTVMLSTSDKVMTIEPSVDSATNNEDANKIEDYLQNVPTPKSNDYKKFKLTVDKDGKVLVTMIDENGANEKSLFPVPVTSID